jgi:hypothetical protein
MPALRRMALVVIKLSEKPKIIMYRLALPEALPEP